MPSDDELHVNRYTGYPKSLEQSNITTSTYQIEKRSDRKNTCDILLKTVLGNNKVGSPACNFYHFIVNHVIFS